ncbi:MAG TPA: ABC transporter permease [Chlamydiales bacterium]|nr:ABC transporter permease [Chlamydiales bacterium]
MLHRILALIYKEFLAVWRDKKSRMVLIIPPMVQLLVFAVAATLDVQNVSIGILNRDNGEQGFELVQRFHGAPTFKHITYLNSFSEIPHFIDTQKGSMVLSIDEQFSRNLDAKKVAQVQLILDGRKSNTTQIVAGYSTTIINRFNDDYAAKQNVKQQNAEIVPRNWYNPNLIYYWYNVPSLCGVLTMLEALIITALSVARERELGTFDQLLVSPMQPIEILIGKSVPAIIISMIAGSVIIFFGVYAYKIPFTGSLLVLYSSMFVFVCAIVGIGLFISSLCSTQQQAILGSFVFMSPSVSLSGFATPVENMPYWLQPWTNLIPLKHFLIITKGSFLKAMPADIVWMNTWPLAIIAVCTLSCATWLFRNKLE